MKRQRKQKKQTERKLCEKPGELADWVTGVRVDGPAGAGKPEFPVGRRRFGNDAKFISFGDRGQRTCVSTTKQLEPCEPKRPQICNSTHLLVQSGSSLVGLTVLPS